MKHITILLLLMFVSGCASSQNGWCDDGALECTLEGLGELLGG